MSLILDTMDYSYSYSDRKRLMENDKTPFKEGLDLSRKTLIGRQISSLKNISRNTQATIESTVLPTVLNTVNFEIPEREDDKDTKGSIVNNSIRKLNDQAENRIQEMGILGGKDTEISITSINFIITHDKHLQTFHDPTYTAIFNT